jgi:hypothetical protein
MRTLNRKLKKLRRKQEKLIKASVIEKEEEIVEEEVLMIKAETEYFVVAPRIHRRLGKEYKYVDETVFPSGDHKVNVIDENNNEYSISSHKVEFLFDEQKRKKFYRFYNHKNLEYNHDSYWKEPEIGKLAKYDSRNQS